MPKKDYSQSSFWEQKYKETCCEPYEWLCKPETVFTSLGSHLDFESMQTVMEIGCGTSLLSSKLVREVEARSGSIEITCLDFSKEVIKKLRESKAGQSNLTYVCSDIRDMKGIDKEDHFDLIFDKGTIDCLFCEDDFVRSVLRAIRQCWKVLRPGGKIIIISHANPKHRVYLLRNKLVLFDVETVSISKSAGSAPQVFAYVCTKKSQ